MGISSHVATGQDRRVRESEVGFVKINTYNETKDQIGSISVERSSLSTEVVLLGPKSLIL